MPPSVRAICSPAVECKYALSFSISIIESTCSPIPYFARIFSPNSDWRGANLNFFSPSETHTVCGWKGTASYYDVVVNGDANKDAAWYYPEAKADAKNIEGYVAFWKGVVVK